MESPDRPSSIQIALSWVGYDEVPVIYANQFLLQYQPENSFVMGVGQSTPPAMLGSPEELAEQARQIEFVPVRTLTRLALTEEKMKELVAVLQASLAKAELVRKVIDPRGGKPA
jgi:hypothetical protein